MIFDAYDFFTPIVEEHSTLKAIYACSGFSEMEGLLADARGLEYPVLVVEDAPDCTLDIGDTPSTNEHHLLYVICDGYQHDDCKRMQAYRQAAELGKELMLKLKKHIRSQEGFRFYNLNESNITMQRIGPMLNGGFGYSFIYSL